jgi:hypothetical protein
MTDGGGWAVHHPSPWMAVLAHRRRRGRPALCMEPGFRIVRLARDLKYVRAAHPLMHADRQADAARFPWLYDRRTDDRVGRSTSLDRFDGGLGSTTSGAVAGVAKAPIGPGQLVVGNTPLVDGRRVEHEAGATPVAAAVGLTRGHTTSRRATRTTMSAVAAASHRRQDQVRLAMVCSPLCGCALFGA